MNIILSLIFLPFILLFSLGIPIIIAVFVYKDAAKRQDCSPILWALVAAFVPSFIGLVIYLLIRNDFPLKDGSGVASSYRTDADGTSYYKSEYDMKAVNQGKFPTWAKVLIIAAAVLVLLLIAAVVIALIKYIFGYTAYSTGFYF